MEAIVGGINSVSKSAGTTSEGSVMNAENPLARTNFRAPPEEFILPALGRQLAAAAGQLNITLLPLSSDVFPQELRQKFSPGPIVVCDLYVSGIEREGTEQSYGYEWGGIINIDHHAPTPKMAAHISSGILAAAWVKARGPAPLSVPVVINHVDCDSVLSALIVRGVIPPHPIFAEAVIAADHTGQVNPIADLLQALEDARSLSYSADALSRLLQGLPQEQKTIALLAKRSRERELAVAAVESKQYQEIGGVVLIESPERLSGEVLVPLFPKAVVIISSSPHSRDLNGRQLWRTKMRLGLGAPPGLTLNEFNPAGFDPAFGGRWNAGSTGRAGGTRKTPLEYARHFARLSEQHLRSSGTRAL